VNATHSQCLPNLFLIGASKAGTTALSQFLARCPHVQFVRRSLSVHDHHREVHRFDRHSYQRTIKSLSLAVEWASSPTVESEQELVVHYTPQYLYSPSVPFELRALFDTHNGDLSRNNVSQQIRFLVMLRDPLERTLSSYWFKESALFRGTDHGSLTDLLKMIHQETQERQRLEQCMQHELSAHLSVSENTSYEMFFGRLRDTVLDCHCRAPRLQSLSLSSFWCPCCRLRQSSVSMWRERLLAALHTCFGDSFRRARLGLRHVDKSLYHDQVFRWLLNFPSQSFLFVSSQALALSAEQTMSKIITFSQQDTTLQANMLHAMRNMSFSQRVLVQPNRRARNASLPSETRQELLKYFDKSQQLLYSLLEDC
jgi:hypothetical protein